MTQATGDVARQLHSRATETVIVPVPPSGPNDTDELDTVASQRGASAGAVMLDVVEAELPQATIASALTRVSKEMYVRRITARRFAQNRPRHLS